jgi:hypothetical protein
MYGLPERARLLTHEKIFRRAVVFAAQDKRDAERLALATCGAVCWLAGVVPGRVVGVRPTLANLNPSRWNTVCAELRRAAREAAGQRNTAHHLAFALLAAVIDSRIIEIGRPSIAPLATDFRDRAVAFVDDLTNTAFGLIAPDEDADHGIAEERLREDLARSSPLLAEQRLEA